MGTMLFDLYRYQIIPTENQLSLLYDLNTIIKKKNVYFEDSVKMLKSIHNKQFNLSIERQKDSLFLLLISRQKEVQYYTEEHEKSKIPSYPPAYIFIDNDPSQQLIAIERNANYSNSSTLVKRFLRSINPLLAKNHLLLKISPIYKSKSFWEYIESNTGRVKNIKFVLITPNMSNISSTLSAQLRDTAKQTKASETEYIVKADGNSHLVIDKENINISSVVDYTSNGGGEIVVRLKGIKGVYSSNDFQLHFEVDEIESKGGLSDICAHIRSVVDGANK